MSPPPVKVAALVRDGKTFVADLYFELPGEARVTIRAARMRRKLSHWVLRMPETDADPDRGYIAAIKIPNSWHHAAVGAILEALEAAPEQPFENVA